MWHAHFDRTWLFSVLIMIPFIIAFAAAAQEIKAPLK
jgi:hypothetical protein